MAELVSLTIQLEPAIAEMLSQMAKDGGVTPEVLAAEAVNQMIAYVIGGEDTEAAADAEEERLQAQFGFIRDTLDEFDAG